jgi:hypothetical protein
VTVRVDVVIEMDTVIVAARTLVPIPVPVTEMIKEVINTTISNVTAVTANTLAVLTRTMDVVERKRALAKTMA